LKTQKPLLIVDFILNLILGVLLLAYSTKLADYFGVPHVASSFYPNILGGVFIGIALALLIEIQHIPGRQTSGLGILGAIVINLCGGVVLLLWLLFGGLDIPMRGFIFLWALAIILIMVSSMELLSYLRTDQ
jgi:hypothetical protein